MLNAIPKAWFSWKFSLEEGDGTPVADLLLSSWRERGSVALRDGLRYTVRSQALRVRFYWKPQTGRRLPRPPNRARSEGNSLLRMASASTR
jgi:hypothetical protein